MASATDKFRRVAEAAATAAINLARPNYFNSSEKGEIYELRNDLNSDNRLVKKEAVKKVIASMTVGKDLSNLFADILKCMQTDDIELKKLVYLYLMNYAKSQPELVILAVNTFCKDTEDPSPLIRALALRTMACIRVERIVDYLCEPLHRTLKDDSPYVRKTAVTCVTKLFDISPDLVDENGFLEVLRGMLGDSNPMVLANVVTALSEIHQRAPELGAMSLDSRNASRLVAALTDCTEWGQVAILDALVDYQPDGQEELEFFIESLIPRLQHVNPSIVLSAIKVLLLYTERLPIGHESIDLVKRKLGPPLISLLSASSPELQFVALRNIRLILQRWPDLLTNSIRVFFCKYTDPLYIKVEKLQMIVQLADENNVEQIYPEITDYSKEVDIQFVRRSIRALGELAIRIPSTGSQAAEILLDLAKTDIRYVVQEVLITARDLLQVFPQAFGRALNQLCRDVSFYDDPDARAALVWLIGEYGEDALPDYLSILEDLLASFKVEPISVQSELFTACLKLFLKDGSGEIKPLIMDLIEKGKSCFESAEFRDRAIFYERLIKLDSSLLRSLNLASSQLVTGERMEHGLVDPVLLAQLIKYLGTLSSIYHKLPGTFLTYTPPIAVATMDAEEAEEGGYPEDSAGFQPEQRGIPVDLLGGLDSDSTTAAAAPSYSGSQSSASRLGAKTGNTGPTNLIDLLS